ncbi:MAG TPA: 4'-phosphopantetheinyl transferase superfamily protein [Spongiibacteraceae bacterium]|jgi:phosphopantetheine--protein transferase-like protein
MPAARLEVLCCPLAEVDDELLARCKNLLSDAESQRLAAFRVESAAKEFIVSRALLRSALAERLQCAPGDLQFLISSAGKPQLTAPRTDYQFNLSHSHAWVVLALSPYAAVGVDVEAQRRRNNLDGIARRFFSAREYARLSTHQNAAWLDYFFAVWTLKEAHAKALGCGLAKILACSSIDIDFGAQTIQLQLSGVARGATEVSSWLYRLDEQTSLALIEHGNNNTEPQLLIYSPFASSQEFALTSIARGRWVPAFQ